MTTIAPNKRETITNDETIHRIMQGEQINEAYEQAYQAALKANVDPAKAKKAGNQKALETAAFLFAQDGEEYDLSLSSERERIFSPMYDRRKIARNVGPRAGFDIQEVSLLSWGVLQALASDDIDAVTRMKILRLCMHFKAHPDCKNVIKPSSGWMRFYCHKPTQDRFQQIEKLYASLLEELGETLSEQQIMLVQGARDIEVTRRYQQDQGEFANQVTIQPTEEPVVEEPVVEEPIVEEPVVEEPVVEEPVETIHAVTVESQHPFEKPVQPFLTAYDSSFTGAISSFSGIIATKNQLIAQYEEQIAQMVVIISNYEKREQNAISDYEVLFKERNELKERLQQVETEFQAYKASHANGDAAFSNALVSMRRVISNLQDAERHAKSAVGVLKPEI